MNIKQKIAAFAWGMLIACPAFAQQTYEEMEQITVNEQVTTVITASEPIRLWIYPPRRWQATNPSITRSG